MRRATIACLSPAFLLLLCYPSPAAAQSTPANPQLPQSVVRGLSLPTGLDFQKHLDRLGKGLLDDKNLKSRALHDLQDALQSSTECGHILIYVPPVTDTKMIIKVPEGVANGRATPTVKACGEDLRRVDAPRPAPPSVPGQDAKSPLRNASFPH